MFYLSSFRAWLSSLLFAFLAHSGFFLAARGESETCPVERNLSHFGFFPCSTSLPLPLLINEIFPQS
jgi:hypothetical protein